MPSWKRLVVICASAGAGFAFALALIVGGLLWHKSRPAPPSPWNVSALKASWDRMDFEFIAANGKRRTIVFYYALENQTDRDYEVKDGTSMAIYEQSSGKHNLELSEDKELSLDYPVFVPARQRVELPIHLNVTYTDEDEKKYGKLPDFMRGTSIKGFVLFDKANRYQINFPQGW